MNENIRQRCCGFLQGKTAYVQDVESGESWDVTSTGEWTTARICEYYTEDSLTPKLQERFMQDAVNYRYANEHGNLPDMAVILYKNDETQVFDKCMYAPELKKVRELVGERVCDLCQKTLSDATGKLLCEEFVYTNSDDGLDLCSSHDPDELPRMPYMKLRSDDLTT